MCADCKVCSLGKLKALFQEIQYNSQGLNAICEIFISRKTVLYQSKHKSEKPRGIYIRMKDFLIKSLNSNYLSYMYC